MPVSTLLRSSVALAALAIAGAVLAQPMGMGRGAPKTFIAGSGPDDLWDVTTKMEMPGMPMAMPPQTNQICIKKGKNTGEESIPKQDNCKVTEMKTVGNKTTFAMECTGDEPMSMRGETTATATSFDSRMSMKGTRRGNSMDMTMTSSGRRVGACTDQTEKVIAAGKSDYEAQIAKICNEATDKFQFEVFSGQQVCSTRKKAFCDKMGDASTMGNRAGFRAVVSKPGVAPVRGSFEFCGLDLVAIAKPASKNAVETKDWAFLGMGVSDFEVREQGPIYCKGRDYYLVDKSLVPMCNRYAAITRGGGATTAGAGGGATGTAPAGGSGGSAGAAPGKSTQTAQTPPPEPPKADPVKQGVDAVRRLLPF